MKFIYNLLSYFFFLFKGLTDKKKFIILTPKFLAKFFKKIIIFNKIKNNFIKQYVRDIHDIDTVYEIFGNEDYDVTKYKQWNRIKDKDNHKIPLIIDCGANIGSSAQFFLQHFSNSKIVCVEPEKNNYEQIKKNLKFQNPELILSAISSEVKKYEIIYSDDNRGFQVDYETTNDLNKNNSVKINDILKRYDNNEYNYFLIKIDIEGSERDLFSKNTEWINQFEIIIIELHDWMLPFQNNSANFVKSLSRSFANDIRRDIIISGENLICIKI